MLYRSLLVISMWFAFGTTAGGADLGKAFADCARAGAKADGLITPLMPDSEKQPTPTQVILLCEDQEARQLFAAMELVAAQTISPKTSIVVRQSGRGVQCFRFPEPSTPHTCMISIEVDGPFVDTLK